MCLQKESDPGVSRDTGDFRVECREAAIPMTCKLYEILVCDVFV